MCEIDDFEIINSEPEELYHCKDYQTYEELVNKMTKCGMEYYSALRFCKKLSLKELRERSPIFWSLYMCKIKDCNYYNFCKILTWGNDCYAAYYTKRLVDYGIKRELIKFKDEEDIFKHENPLYWASCIIENEVVKTGNHLDMFLKIKETVN